MASPPLPSTQPAQCQGPGFRLFSVSGFDVVIVIVLVVGTLFYYAKYRRSPRYLLAVGGTRVEENMRDLRALMKAMRYNNSDVEVTIPRNAGEIAHDLRRPPNGITSLEELYTLGSW